MRIRTHTREQKKRIALQLFEWSLYMRYVSVCVNGVYIVIIVA